MGEYQDPTDEPNDDNTFSFTPPPPSQARPRESLQAKLPRFALLTSHQALSRNGEPPDGIFTATELWELYEHLTGDPLFGAMQLRHGLFTVVNTRHFASVTEQGWSPQYCEGTGFTMYAAHVRVDRNLSSPTGFETGGNNRQVRRSP